MEFTAKFVFSTIKRACGKINSKPVVIMGVNCINDTEWKCNARINKYLFKISFLIQACCGLYFFGTVKATLQWVANYKSILLSVEKFLPAQTILAKPPGCLWQFSLSPVLHKYTKYQVNLITGSVKVNVHDLHSNIETCEHKSL